MMHDLDRTIAAPATPRGRGGLGAFRISGPEALEVARRLFRPAVPKAPLDSGRPVFGRFLGRDGMPVDHGFFVYFAPRRAYTAEPTVELWTHGSPAVLEELLRAALEAGAEAAGPGEFTYRALRHGRLDLTRAEAVRDLIEARTVAQARLALAQAEGSLARRLEPLQDALETWIARAEAAVEFVEESETHLPPGALDGALEDLIRRLDRLLEGFAYGRRVREGVRLAIIGRPNVGKSSLFNRLLEEERAIVTPVPGTTRDLLEETVDLEGVPVRLVDTAGLRETLDPVEHEGVRRADLARREADGVLLVLDATRAPDAGEWQALQEGRAAAGEGRPFTVALNKTDLCRDAGAACPDPRLEGAVAVSAKTGEGITTLRRRLSEAVLGCEPTESPVVTNVRHARALERARRAVEHAREALARGLSEEWVLVDMVEARRCLDEITGAYDVESIYDRIFSTFCIGK